MFRAGMFFTAGLLGTGVLITALALPVDIAVFWMYLALIAFTVWTLILGCRAVSSKRRSAHGRR